MKDYIKSTDNDRFFGVNIGRCTRCIGCYARVWDFITTPLHVCIYKKYHENTIVKPDIKTKTSLIIETGKRGRLVYIPQTGNHVPHEEVRVRTTNSVDCLAVRATTLYILSKPNSAEIFLVNILPKFCRSGLKRILQHYLTAVQIDYVLVSFFDETRFDGRKIEDKTALSPHKTMIITRIYYW